MKLILALPAVGLLFSGLTFLPKTAENTVAPPPPPTQVPRLWASTQECFKDETFDLYFTLPHSTTLGVINPDGHFFYLVFPAACTEGNLKPLVTSEAFATMQQLTICPATLKADPYEYGVMENRAVFTKSGTYRFVLGDDLHVDDESGLNIVSVRYKHKKRPAGIAML
jgi:hypothetical protein